MPASLNAQSFQAAVGWSHESEAMRAGREAATRALRQFSAQQPQLALVFGSSWFDQLQLLEGLHAVLGNLPLAGGSTAGEIGPQGPTSHSCVVLLVASEHLSCAVGYGEHVDQDPRAGGQHAAYAALQGLRKTPRIGFLFFGDGLVTRFADVVRGLQEVLGTSPLLVGGMASDDLRFTQTYQYCNRQVLSQSIVGVLFGGSGKIGVGMEHGFAPISKPRQITKAKGPILVELDRQPAASVYEEYFGQACVQRMRQESFSRERLAYPLGIQCENPNQWLLRNVVSVQADASLACSGEMIEGSWLQLMIGSRELALEAARRAAQVAIQSLNEVGCVVVFDSIARRKLLGETDAALEWATIRQTIGTSVPLVGCYTYGEQAPLGVTSVYGKNTVQTGSVLVIAIGT